MAFTAAPIPGIVGRRYLSRRLGNILRKRGRRVGIVRHPMPYGDLRAQRIQRFATLKDLDRTGATLEEREARGIAAELS